MFKIQTKTNTKRPNKKPYKRKHFITDLIPQSPAQINPEIIWYKPGVISAINFRPVKNIYIRKGQKNKDSYYVIPYGFGFDTEFYTLKQRDDNGHIVSAKSYIYIWQCIIDDKVFLCRDINLFPDFICEVRDKFDLSDKKRLIMLIANSSCEYQFIRNLVKIKNCFMMSEREILRFEIIDAGITVLDCNRIANSNLANIAKDYCMTQKMVGDIDYKLPRNKLTPLTDTELQYCINDVVILSEYFNVLCDMYLKNGYEIPLTATGVVRKAVRELYYTDIHNKYLVQNLKLEETEYNIIRFLCYRGGYTHSNVIHTDEILHNVVGVDFTSSYPAVMLHNKYPMSTPTKWYGTFDRLLAYARKNSICWYGRFELRNIRNKSTHSVESVSKILDCYDIDINTGKQISTHKMLSKLGIVYDNGRILSADKFSVYLTDVDFAIYQMFYDFEIADVSHLMYCRSDRLPEYLLKPMMHFYRKKCQLKRDGKDDTPEYKIAKVSVNCFYGLTVQRLNMEATVYSTDCGIETICHEYNDTNILSPLWGVWVTAHARYNLLSMVNKIGNDVVYCDTDSIYFINPDKHKHLIDTYNADITAQNKTYDDAFADIGCFDWIVDKKSGKRCYDRFKTLGAKRYIKDVGGNVQCTIAGLPKNVLPDYCKKFGLDIYNFFDDDMQIAYDFTCKNAHKYNDTHHEDYITDYLDNTCLMSSESSLGIFDVTFRMSIDDMYKAVINDNKTGQNLLPLD